MEIIKVVGKKDIRYYLGSVGNDCFIDSLPNPKAGGHSQQVELRSAMMEKIEHTMVRTLQLATSSKVTITTRLNR